MGRLSFVVWLIRTLLREDLFCEVSRGVQVRRTRQLNGLRDEVAQICLTARVIASDQLFLCQSKEAVVLPTLTPCLPAAGWDAAGFGRVNE